MATETITPQPDDVLCGKDKKSFNHPGNKKFREVVAFYLERYKNAKKRSEKAEIADSIGAACNGRFLRPDESGVFHELDRRGVREKITHALRDAVRKQLDGRTQREKRNLAAAARAKQQQQQQQAITTTIGPKAAMEQVDPISLAIRKARKQELDRTQRERNVHQAHKAALDAETQAMARRTSMAKQAMEAEQAAIARRHSIAQQTLAARASFTAGPYGHGPYPHPPMGAAGTMVEGGGKPIDLTATAEEPEESAARKVSLPPSPAFAQTKADALLGRSYYEEAALLRNPPMPPPMVPPPPPHDMQQQQQQAAMSRIPALMEQVRTLQMMAAMRDKEIGSLRLALFDATAAGGEKDKEIEKLKEELALKDRALKGGCKRGKTADPPTN